MAPCRHGSAVGLYPNIDTVQIFMAVEYLANDGENIIVGFEIFFEILELFFQRSVLDFFLRNMFLNIAKLFVAVSCDVFFDICPDHSLLQ